MVNDDDSEAQAGLLAEILKNTKILNGSLVVAGEDGVRWRAVGAAARVMKQLEDTEHSQGNFRFSAIAMVPPLTPFFPGSYHTGFGHQFAIALESANTVAAAFTNAPDLRTAKQRLTDTLATAAFDVEAQAQRIDRDTGWAYVGIDLSPAPSKDVSIGAALESLSSQPFGSSGTLTAAATITAAIKDIAVKQHWLFRFDAAHSGGHALVAALERRPRLDRRTAQLQRRLRYGAGYRPASW